jgi:hypothetical protein
MTEKTDQTERKDAGFCAGMPFAETMEELLSCRGSDQR